jgi:hypothetical protein
VRCPAVLPNGTAVANGARYVLKSGRGPIQASPDCTTATCRPVLQDLAVLELTTAGPVRSPARPARPLATRLGCLSGRQSVASSWRVRCGACVAAAAPAPARPCTLSMRADRG